MDRLLSLIFLVYLLSEASRADGTPTNIAKKFLLLSSA